MYERDECLFELDLAIQEANLIQELDMYQLISEKDDENVKATQFNNEEHKTNALDHIKAAINAIAKAISQLMANIGNFIHKIGMSDKEKDMFAAYEAACKKDPNFKNKIIKVRDFRNQQKAYEKVLGEVNGADKKLSRGEFVDMNRLINNWSNTIGDASKAVAKSVTMEYAMNMAKSNINYAKMIESQLGEDSKIMDSIRESLGEKEAAKFKKNIHTYTNRCAGRRFALKLRGKLFNNAEDCALDILHGVQAAIKEDYPSLLNSSATGAGLRAFKGNENVRKIAGEAGKLSKSIKKGKFDATMHKVTAPARAVGGAVSDASTKARRAMGDYSDAPLFDVNGGGILNNQFKKTSKEVKNLAAKADKAIGKYKY